VTRGRLAIHAHFYQPGRANPWSGEIARDPSAAPFHDWNERVDAESYRPNAARGNLRGISWNLGPTIAGWLEQADPTTYAGFVSAADQAIAQAFNHSILPLASAADRLTEVRWGIRDFELRFGRRPRGMWLPETAVDLPTLRVLADEGLAFTILAPWQAAESGLDTSHPYRVDVGPGMSVVVVFYDAGLSAAVSFEPDATSDANRFAAEWVGPRLAHPGTAPFDAPLAVIATDGELYGHHQQFRDLFLQHLLTPDGGSADRPFDVVALETVVAAEPRGGFPVVRIAERTSWSCHHGVARWSAECPDAPDGRWKGPLRAALERLAAGIDVATEATFGRLAPGVDPWELRDAYVEVVVGRASVESFVESRLEPAKVSGDAVANLRDLLEAQRWRLSMFASDGWYWDDPIRPETKQNLRAAARAARLVDAIGETALERRLVADLSLFRSPSAGLDGREIYMEAIAEVGQPPPSV
jgi:hypothetical protein